MKPLFFLILMMFILNLQSQVQWVKTFGGISESGWEEVNSVISHNGNTFVSGRVQQDCILENSADTAIGCNDAFLGSIDINGNVSWMRRIGGVNNTWYDEFNTLYCAEEYAYIVAVDTINHMLYVQGLFTGTISLDGINITAENGDIFISKFDFNGNCIWLKKIGGIDFDFPCRSAGIDSEGNLIISGYLTTNGNIDTSQIESGCFIAKLNPDGQVIYVKNIIKNAYNARIKLFNNNDMLLMIYPRNSSSTSIYINNELITLPHYLHTIIAKVDSVGELLNYKVIRMRNSIGDIDIDSNNNIYVGGEFSVSLEIDSVYLIEEGLNKDMFLLKLNNDLTAIWGVNSYCNVELHAADATSICLDKQDNILVSGSFTGTACFGDYTAISNYYDPQFFVATVSPEGEYIDLYSISSPPTGTSRGYDVAVDNNNDVVISGAFVETIDVGGQLYTSNNGTMDCFVARLNPLNGISETKVNRGNEMIIYANPTTGKCNITIPDDFVNETDLVLSIYDSQGRLIQRANIEMSAETYRLNLEAEAKGIYNAMLTNGKKNYKGRIVFE